MEKATIIRMSGLHIKGEEEYKKEKSSSIDTSIDTITDTEQNSEQMPQMNV